MRAALIGCGAIAHMHISALRQAGVEIAAVCDRDEQKAEQAAERASGAQVYADATALLGQEQLDAVHVLTPPSSHAALAIQAAEAGCHVLVEKPLALSVRDVDAMIAAAERHEVTLAANHNYLYKPSVVKARALVEGGQIGEVVHVDSYYGLSDEAGSYAGPGGAHWAYRLPGGVFTNFLPHLIYLQAAFMGSIESVAGVSVGRHPERDEPPTELSVLLQGRSTAGVMTISTRARPYAKFIRIYGTRGIVHADLVGEVTTVHRSRRLPRLLSKALFNLETVPQLTAGTALNTTKVATGAMRNMPDLHAFVRQLYAAIESGSRAPASGQEGREVVAVMEQVWERFPAAPEPVSARPPARRHPQTPTERRISEVGGVPGKVLVTGATGYLGGHVVAALARCGADIRAVVRDRSRVPRQLERDAEVVTGNLVDEGSIRESMRGVDLVVHAAGVTANNVPWSLHRQTNVDGTRVVLGSAGHEGVRRLLYVSSVVVYGLAPHSRNGAVAESTPYPESVDRWAHYVRSKLEADRMALEAGRDGQVEVTVVRPGLLFGPGAPGPLDQRLLQLGSMRLMLGRGHNVLPLAYVDNVVDGILLALTSSRAAGEAYNLVDEPRSDMRSAVLRASALGQEPTRLVALPAALLSGVAGILESRRERARSETPPRLSRYVVWSATRDVRYDAGKARRELEWEPAVPLDEALRRTFAG